MGWRPQLALLLVAVQLAGLLPSRADAESAAAAVTAVTTAAQLVAAVDSGAAHILVNDHLDFGMQPGSAADASAYIRASATLSSIRVRFFSFFSRPLKCSSWR